MVCKKSQSTLLIPGMFPTEIKEVVILVLQQDKEGNGEKGSETLHFIEKQFHPHATDLDWVSVRYVLVFTFQITVPMPNKEI